MSRHLHELSSFSSHFDRALGVAGLGMEVLGSLHGLYGNDDLFKRAQTLKLYAVQDSFNQSYLSLMMSACGDQHANVRSILMVIQFKLT